MNNNILNSFMEKKKAESAYLTLQNGESVKIINLRKIDAFKKPGFQGGELQECLRLVVDVETSEGVRIKNFDNTTARFASELIEKNVEIGSSFVLTRTGEQFDTRYTVSDVKKADGTPVAATAPAEEATAKPESPEAQEAPQEDHAAA